VGSEGVVELEAIIASNTMFYLVPEFNCVLDDCPKILLDTVLLELQEGSELVADYVAVNGDFPPVASLFGLNTSFRGTDSLISHISVRPESPLGSYSVYVVAAVYNSLWDGSGEPDPGQVSYFSLSGSTNANNTMQWHCIPGNGAGGTWPPMSYLPFQCRG
jgi:hypothetical protein